MIEFESFLEWCEERFSDLKVSGNEIRVNSIFHPTGNDTKHRLWMSPSGGKHSRDYGVYHCFDTDRKGTLVGLIMMVDKCSFSEALEIAGGSTLTADLETQIEDFFSNQDDIFKEDESENGISLPEDCYFIDELDNNRTAAEASIYLESRKIPTKGLMICLYGDYKDRIIIPYYDKDHKLIYFNSRVLPKNDWQSKYLGPPKECGVGKEDVIFMNSWPEPGSKIYVTEGEFDAIVLNLCGLNAAACGSKNLSDIQINYLKDYEITIALDQDKAGKKALVVWYEKLKENGVTNFNFVSPPKTLKDWNDLYLMGDEKIVKAYIEKSEKIFTEERYIEMNFNFLNS